ncbi:chlorophyll A apo protein A2 related protein [Neurospora crassa]|nr:chlorophyll A apoprotein A2 related protein [imported] - Neurospora crassa [Neurospora crassa]KHE85260.1 chlorophyll A apo protein A2 related protein [Neurospora crassa]
MMDHGKFPQIKHRMTHDCTRTWHHSHSTHGWHQCMEGLVALLVAFHPIFPALMRTSMLVPYVFRHSISSFLAENAFGDVAVLVINKREARQGGGDLLAVQLLLFVEEFPISSDSGILAGFSNLSSLGLDLAEDVCRSCGMAPRSFVMRPQLFFFSSLLFSGQVR